MAQISADQKYIVCNADEGDSGTFADRMIMEGDPFVLIEGMTIAGIAVGATRATSTSAPNIRMRSRPQRGDRGCPARGYLGEQSAAAAKHSISRFGSAPAPISVVRKRRCWKASRASAAWFASSHRCRRYGPVRQADRHQQRDLPRVGTRHSGRRRRTIRDFGMGRSRGTMPFQLAGNIKHGGLVERPSVSRCAKSIDDIGGGTASGRPVRAVQVGGPLGAYFPRALLDTPLDYEAFAARDGLVGHGGIVVFDDTVDMAKQARYAMEFCAIESCGKCTPCRIGSTRGVEVIDKILAGERQREYRPVEDLCDTMKFGRCARWAVLRPFR